MEGSIIQIGNSRGLIIPASILKDAGMSKKSKVDITYDIVTNSIVIKPNLRQGWAAAAKSQHAEGADELLNQDILSDDLVDVEW